MLLLLILIIVLVLGTVPAYPYSDGSDYGPSDLLVHIRVLIVEDIYRTADNLAAIVRHWGHDVHIAHDGADALKSAAGVLPHVVLMDLGLPGLDGVQLASLIRERAPGAKLIFIAVTGQPLQEDRCFTAGFDYHFRKPVDLDSLQTLLEAISTRTN